MAPTTDPRGRSRGTLATKVSERLDKCALRVLAALPEDPSWVPRTHTSWFIVTCNSSPRFTLVHRAHTHTYTHINKNKNKPFYRAY